MNKLIINCATGEKTYTPMTAQEIIEAQNEREARALIVEVKTPSVHELLAEIDRLKKVVAGDNVIKAEIIAEVAAKQ